MPPYFAQQESGLGRAWPERLGEYGAQDCGHALAFPGGTRPKRFVLPFLEEELRSVHDYIIHHM